jgi:hypothetical protein
VLRPQFKLGAAISPKVSKSDTGEQREALLSVRKCACVSEAYEADGPRMSMQLCLLSQRWRERRESYRPAGMPINPRLYEVAELARDREATAAFFNA